MNVTQRTLHLTLALALVMATGISACKKQGGAVGSAATGTGAGAGDACTKYATALCEIVGGDTSPSCQGAKSTAEFMSPAACTAGLASIDVSKTKYAGARKVCTALADRLCKDVDSEPETCKMVREQTEKFPVDRCKQMEGQYDQVLASVKQIAERNKPPAPEKIAKMAEGNNPSYGPKDAKVTVVEFSDFQCPFCSRAANAITEVKKKYGDKVRFVFRQFPLSFHQQAHISAQASLAAHAQGKFWEFHDVLFANQSALTLADLEKHAAKAGLQLAPFKKAMKEETYKAAVDADMALGTELAVSGTPTVFINGKRVGNSTDAAELGKAIDEALAATKG